MSALQILVLIFFSAPAYAAGMMGPFLTKTKDVYSLITNIVTPVAAVALAACGIGCLLGSEKAAEKNLGRIKLILIAVACIYLVPLAVDMGKTIAAAHKWNPSAPMS